MVVRKRKKKIKLRGHRFHGKGNTKNKRGAGCKGGRGRAGSHKHKFSKYWMTFGMKRRLKAKHSMPAIKLDDLCIMMPHLIAKGKIEMRGKEFVVDGKKIRYGKILSTGNVNQKLIIRNMNVSAGAREKIEAAGGKVEGKGKVEEKAAGEDEEFEESEEEGGEEE